ncbi:carboxypeptidase-like regulatory domain-containing protein [Planctomycetota bacterium]
MTRFYILLFLVITLTSLPGLCQTASITGTVTSTSGNPVSDATVKLLEHTMSDTTDAHSKYELTDQLVGIANLQGEHSLLRLSAGVLTIQMRNTENLTIEIFDLSSQKLAIPVKGTLQRGNHVFNLNDTFAPSSINLLRITRNDQINTYKVLGISPFQLKFFSGMLAKGAADYTLEASASGYVTKQIPITSLTGVYDIVLTSIAASAKLFYDASDSAISFSARHLKKVLESKGTTASLLPLSSFTAIPVDNYIVLAKTASVTTQYAASAGVPVAGSQSEQDYALRVTGAGATTGYWVLGGDRRGTMYGGIHMAEIVAAGSLSDVINQNKSPYIENRGVKMNIPLDKRTRTFGENGDAFSTNRDDVWDIKFWREYLDVLAIQSYNTVSLWNKHPFPSMVHVKEYPNVTLNDGVEGDNGNKINNWTMNQKIAFWNEVIEYAYNRGIEMLPFVWNVELYAADGKDGISRDKNDPEGIDYLRKATEQLFINYPRLGGIGITSGEKMKEYTDQEKEQYVWDSYGLGVMDVKKRFPKRKIRVIHRIWLTNITIADSYFKNLPDGYEIGAKYCQARLYSHTAPTWTLNSIRKDGGLPLNIKGWWNLRNDDIFYQRWGDPEYVKDMILNFPHETKPCSEAPCLTAGFVLGSDRYLWGRELMSKNPQTPLTQLENEKHWYSFLLWGRLGFEPTLSHDLLKGLIKYRFPSTDASKVFDAWKAASKVIPMALRFHYFAWDFWYYVERGTGGSGAKQWAGFHNIDLIINESETHPDAGYQTIRDYVDGTGTGRTPLEVADSLELNANMALNLVSNLSDGGNIELRETLGDIKSQSHFGLYWAHKIRGGVSLKKFRNNKNNQDKADAISHLEKALDEWKKYADQIYQSYKIVRISTHGDFDLNGITSDVEKDVDIARNAN